MPVPEALIKQVSKLLTDLIHGHTSGLARSRYTDLHKGEAAKIIKGAVGWLCSNAPDAVALRERIGIAYETAMFDNLHRPKSVSDAQAEAMRVALGMLSEPVEVADGEA